MQRQRQPRNNEPAELTGVPAPDGICDGVGEPAASNEEAASMGRIHALDALAQCMRNSALGG